MQKGERTGRLIPELPSDTLLSCIEGTYSEAGDGRALHVFETPGDGPSHTKTKVNAIRIGHIDEHLSRRSASWLSSVILR